MKKRSRLSLPSEHRRHGISLIEMLVVVGIIAFLVALSIPAISKAREAARKTQCQNNLRNIALGLIMFDQTTGRLPASGSYGHDKDLNPYRLHTWAVEILPYVEQSNLHDQLNLDLPIDHAENVELQSAHIPLYICPIDITRNEQKKGDLSYAVNGGIGFTVKRGAIRDCPVDTGWTVLDLNGDGSGCTGTELDEHDKKLFEKMGLFFLETRNTDITKRHLSINSIQDGTTQTFLVAENIRAGFDPNDALGNFADSNPYRCAFYIGNPCRNGSCSDGNIDYSRSNQGDSKINSGLWKAEGTSPVPNSFHTGGVYMSYADGRVEFLSEQVDGAVYASLASPLGIQLEETPLAQRVVSAGQN